VFRSAQPKSIHPTIAEAMTAATIKLLDMPLRLEALDQSETSANR